MCKASGIELYGTVVWPPADSIYIVEDCGGWWGADDRQSSCSGSQHITQVHTVYLYCGGWWGADDRQSSCAGSQHVTQVAHLFTVVINCHQWRDFCKTDTATNLISDKQHPTNAGGTFLSPNLVKFGYVLNSTKIKTFFCRKVLKCFFQLINYYKEIKTKFCFWCRFFIFDPILMFFTSF